MCLVYSGMPDDSPSWPRTVAATTHEGHATPRSRMGPAFQHVGRAEQ